jgi:hypothetical protein
VAKIKSKVNEGQSYEVDNVLVTHNDPKYATTSHKFKLNLIDRTTWTKVNESVIPDNHFDFMAFNDVVQSGNEGQYIGKSRFQL